MYQKEITHIVSFFCDFDALNRERDDIKSVLSSIELRITKDTELGDNDTIKDTKNINRKRKGKQHQHSNGCCGSNTQ